MSLKLYEFTKTVLNTLLSVIIFFLFFRIFFLLFSVNQQTPFVSWIFAVSRFLMAPFAGIAPNLTVQTGIVDISAVITLAVYLFVGYLIISTFNGLVKPQIKERHEVIAHYHDVDKEESKEENQQDKSKQNNPI